MKLHELLTAYAQIISDHRQFRDCPYPEMRSTIPSTARALWRVTVCATRGHSLEDQGHAGPESGCIDITCTRCGYSHGRTWLY